MRQVTLPWWDYRRNLAGVRAFVSVGRSHGVPARRCLSGTGLSADGLEDADTLIDGNQEIQVARNLQEVLGDQPGLGAQAGRLYDLGSVGVLGFTAIAAPNWRQALEIGLRYVGLTTMFFRPSLEFSGQAARMVLDDKDVPLDVRSLLVERDLSTAVLYAGLVLGDSPGPGELEVELDLGDERVIAFRRAVPDTRVVAASTNALTFPSAWMDRPLPLANPTTNELFEQLCRDLLSQRVCHHGVTSAVREAVLERPGEWPSMAQVAHRLHVSVRTLHRQLAQEGTSFRRLDADVRMALARALLANVGMPVGEVADRLGYSEVAAFSRAFKRSTGVTPSLFHRIPYSSRVGEI